MCLSLCHPGHTCTNCKDTTLLSTKQIDVVSDASPAKEVVKPWTSICGIILTQLHKEVLKSPNQWLDDDIINSAQYLLKKQNPSIDGFQSTILSFKFQMEPKRTPFIQILNIHNNHWITISTIGVPPSTVKVYDSNHGKLPHHEQKLVADILQSCQPDIVIHYIDVQKQANASDCGLFSIAFATALNFGQDPAMIYFDQEKMRQHVINCFGIGHMSLFPTHGHRNPQQHTTETISIYCICRLIAEGTMIQCFSCKEWFHKSCVSVPSKFIHNKKLVWNCQSCAGNC